MPVIKPISDLRNYTEVTGNVSYGNRVYLTKNGKESISINTKYGKDNSRKK